MELEQLKAIWDETEGTPAGRRIDAEALSRSRRRVGRLRFLVRFDLAQDAVALGATAWFAAAHLGEPRFLLPALFLLAGFAFHLVSGLRQGAALRAIDWSGPVAAIQERLAALRVERVRAARLLLLLAPLAFAPLLVVAAKGLLGADLWAAPAARAWLAANLVFGAAFLSAGLLLTRALAGRPWASRLGRLLAGQTLAEAERALEASSRLAAGDDAD
ncbi:hypothetical protein FBQ97_02280 [Acidobacteria bacterium ACD]|nr:MAG: hypothetical protein EDX89_04225 [Acidobacteriota bacterium]MDL1948628.1 hypothetical protein [Acidobacteria bacterium ACD]